MKSGPTLNGATVCPARRSAPIKPVATVVFPLPDAGAAITTARALTTLPDRREQTSPLDALLSLAPGVHRVLDLGHLGDEVGRVKQLLWRITAGEHEILRAGSLGERRDHFVNVHPSPLQRIREFVEQIKAVALLRQPARNLGPAIGGRGGVIVGGGGLPGPRPAGAPLLAPDPGAGA